MKTHYLFLIALIFVLSCSEKDIPAVDEETPIIKEEKEEKEENNQNQDVDIFGQWNFFNSQTTKSGTAQLNDSTNTSTTDICGIRTIIFKQDSTFVLYTEDYALFGDYSASDSIIILSIQNNIIGEITDFEFDDSGTALSGSFDFSNLCVTVNEGYKEENYYENLTYIPDDNLEQFLVDNGFDDIMDDYVLTSKLESVGFIAITADDLGYVDGEWQDLYGDDRFKNRIKNLSGIEAFKSLRHLNLTGNKLDSINISQNTKLEAFGGNFNEFKKVDTSNNPELNWFSLGLNEGVNLDFTKNHKLKMLDIASVGLDEIDLSNNSKLTFLDLNDNNLTSIDLGNLTKLIELRLGSNQLTSVDVSQNTDLEILWLMSNKLTSVDLSKLTKLKTLELGGNQLKNIDLRNNLELEKLKVSSNNLVNIDISMLTKLEILEIGNPNMECIHVNQRQYDLFQSGEWKNPWNVPYSTEPCE